MEISDQRERQTTTGAMHGEPSESPNVHQVIEDEAAEDERAIGIIRKPKAELTGLFARLLMLDDDTNRLQRTNTLYDALIDLTVATAVERRVHLIAEFQSYCVDLGIDLHKQYDRERKLAESRQLPERKNPGKLRITLREHERAKLTQADQPPDPEGPNP